MSYRCFNDIGRYASTLDELVDLQLLRAWLTEDDRLFVQQTAEHYTYTETEAERIHKLWIEQLGEAR